VNDKLTTITKTLQEIQQDIADPSFILSESRVYQTLEALIVEVAQLRTENALLGKDNVDLREALAGFLKLAEEHTWPSFDRRASAQRLLARRPSS